MHIKDNNASKNEMHQKTFTEIDEEFICENCGKKVPKLGYSCRNHCPYCLHSKHIDKNPGDRQEECHGDLEPIGLEINGKKGYVIIFKCKKCGKIRKNKAAIDDNMDLIIKLSVPRRRCFLVAQMCHVTQLLAHYIILFKFPFV